MKFIGTDENFEKFFVKFGNVRGNFRKISVNFQVTLRNFLKKIEDIVRKENLKIWEIYENFEKSS